MATRNRATYAQQRTPRCWPVASHRGFTLLELMIAMAIMAAALSVAWPLLRRPLLQNASQEAAQQVIATLGQARATAISLGVPIQVRYQPGGQLYQLRPVHARPPAGLPPSRTTSDPSTAPARATPPAGWQDHELPIDVTFAAPLLQRRTASLSLLDALDQPAASDLASQNTDRSDSQPADRAPLRQVTWSTPIHFFPDGRADQAKLSLHGPDAVVIDITLRGLTGTATAGTPQKRPGPPTSTSPLSLSKTTNP